MQTEKNQGHHKNHDAIFEKDIGHTVGAVSRYDQEYLKYYLPDVNVEVSLGFILLYFLYFYIILLSNLYNKEYFPFLNYLQLIPSSGMYTTCNNNEYCGQYNPSTKEMLIFHHRDSAKGNFSFLFIWVFQLMKISFAVYNFQFTYIQIACYFV